MSDNLAARVESHERNLNNGFPMTCEIGRDLQEAAARIEALTAALEKADALAATLQWYGDQCAIMKKPTIDAQWATNRLRDDRGEKSRQSAHAYREARKATT